MITPDDLKIAALAADLTPVRMGDYGIGLLVAEQAEPWRPHTDPVSALLLASKIRARASFEQRGEVVVSCGSGAIFHAVEHDGTKKDSLRAWCEAVTLCAASLGRREQEFQR